MISKKNNFSLKEQDRIRYQERQHEIALINLLLEYNITIDFDEIHPFGLIQNKDKTNK